ncbi:hypothetical protein PFISCL1PPCAC_95 [Pristionchus fissidentatus]|uniref:Uncharacterized protein n=1 Tax=Pristionchus fissidentatus TaxID=1538716 RepID=A0AAV5URJ9_9BILA|nr:hypothetical protein PFISCL1PPCAC_95 [Pristionchus fissidentatus]
MATHPCEPEMEMSEEKEGSADGETKRGRVCSTHGHSQDEATSPSSLEGSWLQTSNFCDETFVVDKKASTAEQSPGINVTYFIAKMSRRWLEGGEARRPPSSPPLLQL